MSMTDAPAIGHNMPPLPTAEDVTKDLKNRYADLEESVSIALAEARNLPAPLTSPDDVKKYADVARLVATPRQTAEAARKKEKAPVLIIERAIDGHFAAIDTRLAQTQAVLNKRTKVYQDQVAEEARQAAAAAAAKARAEEQTRLDAAAAEALANHKADVTEHVNAAVASQSEARAADKVVAAKPAEHTRTRSDTGAMATTTSFWNYEIADEAVLASPAAGALLWQYITPAEREKAVRAFVKANEDKQPLPGVRIFRDTKPMWR